jgi:hypothetical protein
MQGNNYGQNPVKGRLQRALPLQETLSAPEDDYGHALYDQYQNDEEVLDYHHGGNEQSAQRYSAGAGYNGDYSQHHQNNDHQQNYHVSDYGHSSRSHYYSNDEEAEDWDFV